MQWHTIRLLAYREKELTSKEHHAKYVIPTYCEYLLPISDCKSYGYICESNWSMMYPQSIPNQMCISVQSMHFLSSKSVIIYDHNMYVHGSRHY